MTTTYDRVGGPSTLAGSLSGTNTTYISQTTYGLFGLPYYFARGNNVWHAQAYNSRMQPTESYEATNNQESGCALQLRRGREFRNAEQQHTKL